jgi:hypothetical protein
MDGAGVLFDERDPRHVAELIDAIVSDWRLQDAIVDGQRGAARRLLGQNFGGTVLGFVDEILRMPRCARPHVAFDFWEQFDRAEQLEELRLYRPSIYKALPAEAS